jgi:hypothetical protein
MALVVTQQHKSKRGSKSVGGKRNYSVTYTVSGVNGETVWEIMNADGIPQEGSLGATNDEGIFVVCQDVSCEQTDNPSVWFVHCSYSSGGGASNPKNNSNPIQNEPNPLNRPPVWSCTSQRVQEYIEWAPVYPNQTLTNNSYGTITSSSYAVANSVGDKFTDVMVDRLKTQITVQRFVASWNITNNYNYVDHINAAAWYGIPQYYVKVENISGSDHYENGITCVDLKIDLLVNYEPWCIPILNTGLRQYDVNSTSTPKKIIDIRDANGVAITEPRPLDVNGYEITEANPTTSLFYKRFVPWKTCALHDLVPAQS